MTPGEVLDIGREAIMASIFASAPIMLIGLGVGVAIALFQALTQIQEMTLTFVPKILAIFAALLVLLPPMGAVIGDLATAIFARMATL